MTGFVDRTPVRTEQRSYVVMAATGDAAVAIARARAHGEGRAVRTVARIRWTVGDEFVVTLAVTRPGVK